MQFVRRKALTVTVAAIAIWVAVLYWPALSLELTSDDFQWAALAHRALHRPALLFADLDTFYRPGSTWTLAVDRLLWGANATAFHLSNLLLHLAAASGLVLVARRVGIGAWSTFLIGLLWAGSAHTLEPAIAVAIRFESLLFIGWLALVLVWPGDGERFSTRRLAVVAAIFCFLAGAKETWVVTPGFVLALELGLRRLPLRRALASAGRAALPVGVYMLGYFLAFPGGKRYFESSLSLLAKVPAMAAAFFGFAQVQPGEFHLEAPGLIALALLVPAAILAIRKRPAAGIAGVAFLVLPVLPTLFVPYLPSRYLAIPFAGFLLILGAAVESLIEQVPARLRVASGLGCSAAAIALLASGTTVVRGDLADARQISQLTAGLLAEARLVAPSLPMDRPVVFARVDRDSPLNALSRQVSGSPKIFFVRSRDPYGLADTAAVLEWALADGTHVCWDPEPTLGAPDYAMLLHSRGSFRWVDPPAATIGEALDSLERSGLRPRVFRRVARARDCQP